MQPCAPVWFDRSVLYVAEGLRVNAPVTRSRAVVAVSARLGMSQCHVDDRFRVCEALAGACRGELRTVMVFAAHG